MIKRLIDPEAESTFTSAEEIEEIAKEREGDSLRRLGTEAGHQGDRYTFDAMAEKCAIKELVIFELAMIVRAGETDRAAAVTE